MTKEKLISIAKQVRCGHKACIALVRAVAEYTGETIVVPKPKQKKPTASRMGITGK